MKVLNQASKMVYKSLDFLETPLVRMALIAIVVLYAAGVAPNLSLEVSSLLSGMWAKLVMMLVILYISVRDPTLALMLTIALLLSLQVNARNQVNGAIAEGMANAEDKDTKKKNEDDKKGKDADKDEGEADDKKEQMSNGGGAPTGANTAASCLEAGATCTGDLSNACTGVQVWGTENNAQGLSCGAVRGFSSNDYQGAPF